MRFRIKTAKHHVFSFEPRYYDPVKEEIEGKLRAAESNANHPETASRSSYISTAFKLRAKQNNKSNMMQLMLAIVLLGTFVAWMFYGNDVFYAFLLLSPAYFYFRLKKKKLKIQK